MQEKPGSDAKVPEAGQHPAEQEARDPPTPMSGIFEWLGQRSRPLTKLSAKERRTGQDLWFRWTLFMAVMLLMVGEVLVLVVIMFKQGNTTNDFDLDPFVLASFEVGVLLQTFALASVITKALFPRSD